MEADRVPKKLTDCTPRGIRTICRPNLLLINMSYRGTEWIENPDLGEDDDDDFTVLSVARLYGIEW
jgi:hypothetical protein